MAIVEIGALLYYRIMVHNNQQSKWCSASLWTTPHCRLGQLVVMIAVLSSSKTLMTEQQSEIILGGNVTIVGNKPTQDIKQELPPKTEEELT